MASGIFEKGVGAVRPGTYVNFVGKMKEAIDSANGTVVLPLSGTSYGPAHKFIKLTADAPDASRALLGHSIYDDSDDMLMIREAFKGAGTVIVYILAEGKTAATGTGGGVTATAKYKGTLGNALTYSIAANPVSGYDVDVFMAGVKLESYEGVTEVAELSGSQYINFAATGGATLSATVRI